MREVPGSIPGAALLFVNASVSEKLSDVKALSQKRLLQIPQTLDPKLETLHQKTETQNPRPTTAVKFDTRSPCVSTRAMKRSARGYRRRGSSISGPVVEYIVAIDVVLAWILAGASPDHHM